MKALGLRGQILSALFFALVLAFSLLSVAVVQLTNRAQQLGQQRNGEALAQVLVLARRHGEFAFETLATDLVAQGLVDGLELVEGSDRRVWGNPGRASAAYVQFGEGKSLHVWPAAQRASPASLSNLLLFYVGITGGAILVLGYLLLTALIVRPVGALTRASERMAGGNLEVEVPIDGAGEISRLAVSFNGMAAQLRDDRRALEQRLGELEKTTQDLESAQDQVVRSAKLASVGRLSAGFAHEIGNPLAAVLGLLELLRDRQLDPATQEEFVERAHRETQRIHTILQDLLAFARREPAADGADEVHGNVNLVEVIKEAIELLRPQKDMQRVNVQWEFDDSVRRVPGSAQGWTQLAINLLLNAADAVEGEGDIHVVVRNQGQGVTLLIADSGTGIAPDLLPQVFDPFVTSKAPGKGTGLGLAICHTLVERLGGQISARNGSLGGAEFEVWVPASEDPTAS